MKDISKKDQLRFFPEQYRIAMTALDYHYENLLEARNEASQEGDKDLAEEIEDSLFALREVENALRQLQKKGSFMYLGAGFNRKV